MSDKKLPFIKESLSWGNQELKAEIGDIAPQASGSVLLTYGETVVLSTAVMAKEKREGVDFLPLVVDYEERLYAAGKISGSRFVKREGRPSEEAVLSGRLIDRSLRPLFPKGLYNDIQIVTTILSFDSENDPDIAALNAASLALCLSNIPFAGPIGAARIGRIGGKYLLNPSYSERNESDLDLIVAATKDKVIMIEAGAKEVSEEDFLKAIEFGYQHIQTIIAFQEKIIAKIRPVKKEIEAEENFEKIEQETLDFLASKLTGEFKKDKLERDKEIAALKEALTKHLEEKYQKDDQLSQYLRVSHKIFNEEIKKIIRKNILEKGKRPDGRQLTEIRPLTIKVGLLPRTHGSGFFQRGYTQVLTIATLAPTTAAQIIDGLEPETEKNYMHHYNFPAFSVGEVGPMRSPSRREIGHGALAEKALLPVIPDLNSFPYTIRLVSEVLSSDGSTSMASTCGSTLALMDAGIPIKNPVAGIAMGLVTSDSQAEILTDIAGLEDFCGDMDFKAAGTKNGLTAVQMDLKIPGLSLDLLSKILARAKSARLEILEAMLKVIPAPRPQISPYAPQVAVIKINPNKIGDLIGPAGKIINKIIEQTNSEIDIDEDGTVRIFAKSKEMLTKAKELVQRVTKEVKIGEIYQGKVVKITDFGAFVEIFPGQEGLVHISQLADYRVSKVEDIVKVGDIIPVMVIGIDETGRISLSYKAAQGNSK